MTDLDNLTNRLRAGDPAAAGELFAAFRDLLKKMVRLSPRSQAPGSARRVRRASRSFHRRSEESRRFRREGNAGVSVAPAHHRREADHPAPASPRHADAGRGSEVPLNRGGPPAATTHSSANLLLGRLTSPTQAAVRAERQLRLQEALNGMDRSTARSSALRHFEELSNGESAAVLGLTSRPRATATSAN